MSKEVIEYRIRLDHYLEEQENRRNGNGAQNSANKKSSSGVSKAIAVQIGVKAVQYAVSNYGSITGDYIGQQNMNDAITIGGYAATIAKGGLAGVAIVGADISIKAISRFIEIKKSNQEAQVLRDRTGLSLSEKERR